MLKISVIVPTYNAGEFLAECLTSIASQRYANCEVIIVDGLSIDNTLEVAHSFDPILQLRIVAEPDNGQAEAVSKGLRLATGDILHWHAADDLMLPGALIAVNRAFEGSKLELLYSDGFAFDQFRLVRTGTARWTSFWTTFLFMGRFQSDCAYWRSSITHKGLPLAEDMPLNCDEDFFLRIWAGSKSAWLPQPLGAFRIRPGQLSQTISRERLTDDRKRTRRSIAKTLHLTAGQIFAKRLQHMCTYFFRDLILFQLDRIYNGIIIRRRVNRHRRALHRLLMGYSKARNDRTDCPPLSPNTAYLSGKQY